LTLDRLLNDIEIQATDNDDLIRKLAEHSIHIDGDLSYLMALDPLSDEYRDAVGAVHEEIIGKSYSTTFEGLPELNPDWERDWPFPWGTKSPETVARFLIAYGFLIKSAGLPPHARILEVGCGVGSLTCNLARMGYRVDALDPNTLQCEIVRAATSGFPVAPNVMSMTLDQWLESKSGAYKYDAVIFFESFHHIANHRDSLRSILNSHLEIDGKILLGAEPIFQMSGDTLPYPWGPRLDGESMRAMRRWGWLELGFTEAYLRALFAVLGLTFQRLKCEEAMPLSQIVIGWKALGSTQVEDLRYEASLEEGVSFAKEGLPSFLQHISGLAEREPWGRWSVGDRVEFCFKEKLPKRFVLKLEFADIFGPNVHKTLEVRVGDIKVRQLLKEIGVQRTYCFEFDGVDAATLELGIPHPCRPKDIIELYNEDPRKIGLAFVTMTIEML
jgi:2-polyprenyl-3-methyl-5-hydroxy-6-metoxy-1,4-benzoquinol methylase